MQRHAPDRVLRAARLTLRMRFVLLSWKLWLTTATDLMSPWASTQMPATHCTLRPDGAIDATCLVGHSPPHTGCGCGLYCIHDASAMLQYKAMSGATTPHRYAMTYGTAEGRVVRGHFGTPAMTPMPGLCATTYRVRAILTEGDGRGLVRYRLPVYRGRFTLANMREIERLELPMDSQWTDRYLQPPRQSR